jgi:hypothetical protein
MDKKKKKQRKRAHKDTDEVVEEDKAYSVMELEEDF